MDSPVDIKEAKALEELKRSCEDLKQEDLTILRFLRARDGDTEKGEEMLRKSIEWRQENDVSSYCEWMPPKEIQEDFKFSCIGQDHEGYAVMYVPIGKWCIRDRIEQGLKDEAFQFRFSILEKFMKYVSETKQSQFVIVLDLKECTYRKVAHTLTIQLLVSSFRDFEANYPERLRAAYVINAPWVFPYVYAFVKPMLSGHTLSKVKIFDANVAQWKPALLERIPEHILPEECRC